MRKPSLCIKDNPSEKHPWRIEGHRENGKRKRLFFKTKGEAETRLAQLKAIKAREGEDAANLTMEQRADAVRAMKALRGHSVTLEAVALEYVERMKAIDRSRSFSDVYEELIEAKENDGASREHLNAMKVRLKKFREDYGDKLVAAFTSHEIDDWLRGQKLVPQTRKNYRDAIRLAFNFAISRDYCEKNPVDKVGKVKVVASPPEVFTPDEVARIMGAAASEAPEIIPFLGIGFFAGVRVAEIGRMDWKEVRLERGFLEVTAKSAKTSSRRLIDIEPNLAAWLAPYARKSGAVLVPNHRKLFEMVRRKSGVKWKANGMRHSFASYHLARGQNAAATAMLLGHPNTNMLYAHYRELVAREEAETYFQIIPAKDQANIVPLVREG